MFAKKSNLLDEIRKNGQMKKQVAAAFSGEEIPQRQTALNQVGNRAVKVLSWAVRNANPNGLSENPYRRKGRRG